MTEEFKFDVFLSHNSKDKPAVRKLRDALCSHGLRVWLDKDELRPGIPWQKLLEAGIKNSKSVAVLVGNDGLGPWEDEEMQAALQLAVKDGRPVIPVLLPGATTEPELPMFLSNRTWVDLRAGITKEGLDELVWGITGVKPERGETPSIDRVIIAPTRLRHGADRLFGREEELKAIDEAWSDPSKHILTFVAWGGVGKTSLVVEWMGRKAAAGWPGFEYVFDWSFYSQGTREQGGASSDAFMAEALKFFGDAEMAESAASAWDKGARLAQLVAQKKTLLVLDGIEPLQYPPGQLAGHLKDPALETLLRGLAQNNPGLCVVTTRERVANLESYLDTTAPEWKLDKLSEEAGAALLHKAGANRAGAVEIREDDKELKEASKEVEGHALTLRLLGGFLGLAEGGDIRKRKSVRFEEADREFRTNPADADKPYGHAFKVMGVYGKWLAEGGEDGARQLAVLRLMGLFDRPAKADCLAALRKEPAIEGMTEPLVGISDTVWKITLSRLAECNLVSVLDDQSAVDAHPLIREYFAKQLREKNLEGWRAAHKRLYEFLTESTEHRPDTLEGLQPLYQAVAHGCQAGLYQEVLYKVYQDRILRGTGEDGFYSTNQLGAFGADLGAVACFFEQPWSRLADGISESDRAWLLHVAATRLRALGRLTEALEPQKSSIQWSIKNKQWRYAIKGTGNLSELELTLGNVADAVQNAKQSVDYADRNDDTGGQFTKRTTLADAKHQAGRGAEALELFREAEAMSAKATPKYPLLYSLWGYRYCDLLLATPERAAWGKMLALDLYQLKDTTKANSTDNSKLTTHNSFVTTCREVEKRVAQTLNWAEGSSATPLLDFAWDHLTLGRAAFYRAILTDSMTEQAEAIKAARQELSSAVDGLRHAGTQLFVPLSLLSRAWLRFMDNDESGARADLEEALQIAERGPMKLHMADICLYRARLFRDKEALAKARGLIEECGYHRRDEELAEAEIAAKNW